MLRHCKAVTIPPLPKEKKLDATLSDILGLCSRLSARGAHEDQSPHSLRASHRVCNLCSRTAGGSDFVCFTQCTCLEPLPTDPSRAKATVAAAPLVRRCQRHRTRRGWQVVSHLRHDNHRRLMSMSQGRRMQADIKRQLAVLGKLLEQTFSHLSYGTQKDQYHGSAGSPDFVLRTQPVACSTGRS